MKHEFNFLQKYFTTETFNKLCYGININIPHINKKIGILFEKINLCLTNCIEKNINFNATYAFRDCKDGIVFLLLSDKVSPVVKAHLLKIVCNCFLITIEQDKCFQCSSISFFESLIRSVFNDLPSSKSKSIRNGTTLRIPTLDEIIYGQQISKLITFFKANDFIITLRYDDKLFFESLEFFISNFQLLIETLINYVFVNDKIKYTLKRNRRLKGSFTFKKAHCFKGGHFYGKKNHSKRKDQLNDDYLNKVDNYSSCCNETSKVESFSNKNLNNHKNISNDKEDNAKENVNLCILDVFSNYLGSINEIITRYLIKFMVTKHSSSITKSTLLYKYIKRLTKIVRPILLFVLNKKKINEIRKMNSICKVIFQGIEIVCAYLSKYFRTLDFYDIDNITSTWNKLFASVLSNYSFLSEFTLTNTIFDENLLSSLKEKLVEQQNYFADIEEYFFNIRLWCQNALNMVHNNKQNEFYLNTLICDVECRIWK
uniref:DHC_N1 domain-containing protein n=1 Tax=Strongyloides papillosus TaxID=174720 RepID=A0A0N5C9Z1_STREA